MSSEAPEEVGAIVLNNKPANNWTASVPLLLAERNCRVAIETPESVRELYAQQGRFCQNSHVGKDLEMMVMEAFADDLFDGEMHCLSIRDTSNNKAIGIIFWRDISDSDMKSWVKRPFADELRQLKQKAQKELDGDAMKEGALTRVGDSHGKWGSIFGDWVKIELVCTHPDYYGRRVGTMLMMACLVWSVQHKKLHSVLHVAGGEENVAAVRLYRRFGFEPVPQEAFNLPNNNMYVLGDMHKAVRNMDVAALLGAKKVVPKLDKVLIK